MNRYFTVAALLALLPWGADAQNPIIKEQFTADPTARVFEGKMYVYPSHDIPAPEDYARKDWFCMADYHVYSSENLVDWRDHGVILSQGDPEWVNSKSYSMWAPDCVLRNGKYYFYFPANPKDSLMRMGTIGVATSDKPYGPFVPEKLPIKGTRGIDPSVFVDDDGQAYMYWAGGNIFMAKLKDNMLELDGPAKVVENLPKGFKEGPFFFKRAGKYYLTFPYVKDKTEILAYSMSDSPEGPFEYKGLIMDQSATGCWTNHHSIVEYKGQWYLFYHHNDYSPKFDKNRSVRVDSLFFNADGTIRQVMPTERGVGITPCDRKIEIDRFSKKAEGGVAIEYLDKETPTLGWKCVFTEAGAWVSYNSVQFAKAGKMRLSARVKSAKGAVLQVACQENGGNRLIGELKVPASDKWQDISAAVKGVSGLKNLVVSMKSGAEVELDYISFGNR